MWFRWLATVRSPRNSAAATSRFVLPSATRAATRSSAAVSPFRPGAPADPSELGACPGRPACCPDRLEAVERGLDRLASAALLASATSDDAEREQCAGAAERVADGFVLGDRLREQVDGVLDVSAGGGGEAATPGHVREHPLACDPCCIRLPYVEQAHGVFAAAHFEQKLHVVAGPPADARLAPTHLRSPTVGSAEPLQSSRPISTPLRDESDDGEMLGRLEPELLHRQVQRPLANARARARAARDGRR